MRAYLDFNIIIEIEKGNLTVAEICNSINKNITQFPFSSAHIIETDTITASNPELRDKWINQRLSSIENISQRAYIYYEVSSNTAYLQERNPTDEFKSTTQFAFAKSAMQGFMNLFPQTLRDKVRDSMGIESHKLNNYTPNEVVEQLNKKLIYLGFDMNFIELIELGISKNPDGANFSLYHRFAAIFEVLDLFGYWRDTPSENSAYARIWDASHCFHASYCQYFVSNDKRTRYKARVVYNIYNIHTIVVSSKGEN